jgi:inosine/xanthosine triphosphate pyrophosphatase family protein
MSGDQFRVSISNLVGPPVVSNAATLTVQNVGPTISVQPVGVAVNPGGAISLSVSASGTPPLAYQWQKDGTSLAGATNATLTVTNAQLANGGTYTVLVSNALGVTTSNPATVWINTAPVVTTPPRPQVALLGGNALFTAAVSGSSDMTYQWRKDGVAIAGATGANLLLGSIAASSSGLYDVVITNSLGTTASSVAQLTILTVQAAPVITSQPASQTVLVGSSVTLSVAAAGTPAPNYQWRKNGAAIAGANAPTLSLTNAQPGDAANYDVVVSNSVGSTTSAPATLRVISHSFAGVYFGTFSSGLGTFAVYVRRDNTAVFLGILSSVPAQLTALNLAIDGSGNFSFSQPASSAFGAVNVAGTINNSGTIAGTLGGAASGSLAGTRSADSGPTQALMGFYLAGSTSGAGSVLSIVNAAGQVYAIAQAGTNADGGAGGINSSGQVGINTGRTIILETLSPTNGSATATVTGVVTGSFTGATDTALALQRLANISSRAKVGTGDAVEIAGFVISGTDSKPVLIRAVGPTLARQYNIAGALVAPRLDLYRGTTLIATNTNVNSSTDAASIQAAAAKAGAFAFAPNAADSALLVTLAPGLYSAQVSGADGGSGVALVEVYDLSAPSAGQKIINISTRAFAASGDNTLIAGVIVTGSVPKRVLVRAVGPGLANYSVTGWLAQPVLALTTLGGQPIAQNTGWSTSPDAAAITAASSQTGAFPLISGDSALIVTLAPGAYSAQVSGANGTSGIALVEIYELQ